MSTPEFSDWMRSVQAHTEAALAARLPAENTSPARLHQAMRYACLGGGKRVRPLLAFAAGELSGAPLTRLEIVSCAVEMIHAYSLVHDDLPAMDNDVLRRGRPTCHVAYDEPTALLVGDALQAEAFACLAAEDLGARQIDMIRLLADAAGSTGMAGGQAIDLDSVGQSLDETALQAMHAKKTGALIRAAVLLGAFCGETLDAGAETLLDRFASRAGLLFQVVDDILDCTASTAELGKTAGKDAAAEKPTYVRLLGLSGAQRFAAELQDEAIESLSSLEQGASRLVELTRFIAQRRF